MPGTEDNLKIPRLIRNVAVQYDQASPMDAPRYHDQASPMDAPRYHDEASPKDAPRNQDVAEAPVSPESQTYELGAAFVELRAREQRVRKELQSALQDKSRLEMDMKTRRQAHEAEVRRLSDELSVAYQAIPEREQQIREDESQTIKEELDIAKIKHSKMGSVYEELYRYCETLLIDAERRRKDLESQCREITSKFQRADQQERAQKSADERRVIKLGNELSEARAQIESTSRELDEARAQLKQAEGRARALERNGYQSRMGVEKSLESLNRFLTTMDDLQKALRGFIDTTVARGVTPVTQKAGIILIEQIRSETDDLRRLQAVLAKITLG